MGILCGGSNNGGSDGRKLGGEEMALSWELRATDERHLQRRSGDSPHPSRDEAIPIHSGISNGSIETRNTTDGAIHLPLNHVVNTLA